MDLDSIPNGTSPPSCGCKGIRTCALCESSDRVSKLQKPKLDFSTLETFVYIGPSPSKKLAKKIKPTSSESPLEMDEVFEIQRSLRDRYENGDDSETMFLDNVFVIPDFLSQEEEIELVTKIDSQPWILSQSGRRKQDYGPKVNFKHRKVKLDHYTGMPAYSSSLLAKMSELAPDGALSKYVPFELCNLEYDPDRRSCIDFHTDDTWIWGERLISINLLAGSVMCLKCDGRLVYVPMPRLSLLCMAGPMRYEWTHGVLPEHIQQRRIALTMREPSKLFQPDGELYEKWGRTLIERAKNFIEV